MATFTYDQNACPVQYENCLLDSLTELRYLLSIEETHAYLREDIGIYYETESFAESQIIQDGLRKYTPDFLVRNWKTGIASLVEIKPKGFKDFYALSKRRKIAEDFIQFFGYDWQYKVILGSEIVLTDHQQNKFESIIQTSSKHPLAWHYFSTTPPYNPFRLSVSEYERFVREGLLPGLASPD